MKKLALIIGVVLLVLAAASIGFAAPAGHHGGHHSSYGHGHHGYHGGYYGGYGYLGGYGYYPGYRYVGAPYVIGAPGIYIGAPYGPRVFFRAYPY
jgi:hypothetical protein